LRKHTPLCQQGFAQDHLTPALSEGANESTWAAVLRSLCQNDLFRREFVTALCDVRSIRLVDQDGKDADITEAIKTMLDELRKGKEE
jgi:hypothetical protein